MPTDPLAHEHPDDVHHVMLDCIGVVEGLLKAHGTIIEPWDAYETDPHADPKAGETGWRALLAKAERLHRSAIDGSDPERFTTEATPTSAPAPDQGPLPTAGDVIAHLASLPDGEEVGPDELDVFFAHWAESHAPTIEAISAETDQGPLPLELHEEVQGDWEVTVANTWEADTAHDALGQMVEWVNGNAYAAGYRVTAPDGRTVILDAEKVLP